MTEQETLAYIDDEFDVMRGLSIHGDRLSPGMYAVLKMIFIAGMSATLAYPGDDVTLGKMVRVAMANISKRYGDRTIFPFEPLEESEALKQLQIMPGSLSGATVSPLEGEKFSGVMGIPIGFRRENETDNEVCLRYLDFLDKQEKEGK
jgi:hypothetical protein